MSAMACCRFQRLGEYRCQTLSGALNGGALPHEGSLLNSFLGLRLLSHELPPRNHHRFLVNTAQIPQGTEQIAVEQEVVAVQEALLLQSHHGRMAAKSVVGNWMQIPPIG